MEFSELANEVVFIGLCAIVVTAIWAFKDIIIAFIDRIADSVPQKYADNAINTIKELSSDTHAWAERRAERTSNPIDDVLVDVGGDMLDGIFGGSDEEDEPLTTIDNHQPKG